MPKEYPFDPTVADTNLFDDEEDLLLPEGKAAYSWEKFSTSNSNEGWGQADRSDRRRRRRFEGDDFD